MKEPEFDFKDHLQRQNSVDTMSRSRVVNVDLQKAIKLLPLEVLLDILENELKARPDFTVEDAQRVVKVGNDILWELI